MGDEEQNLVQGSEEERSNSKPELTVDEVVGGYVGSLGLSLLLHV